MFADVGQSPITKPIIKLRNEIIHSGVSEIPSEEKKSLHSDIIDIAREYLLRLIGYSGEYLLYSKEGNRSKEIN